LTVLTLKTPLLVRPDIVGEAMLFAYANTIIGAGTQATARALSRHRGPHDWYSMTLADVAAIFGPHLFGAACLEPKLEIVLHPRVVDHA